VRQARLIPQAIKDVASFDAGTRDTIKDAIRHLADHPSKANRSRGNFRKIRSGPTGFSPIDSFIGRPAASG